MRLRELLVATPTVPYPLPAPPCEPARTSAGRAAPPGILRDVTDRPGRTTPWRGLARALSRWADAAGSTGRVLQGGLSLLVPEAPLELRIAGRVLLHAAVVGLLAGVVGAAFFAALEVGQHLLLHGLAGFDPARARGEAVVSTGGAASFRPWLLALLPAAGGLVSGLLTSRLAPETAGGGGDATIEAYQRGGLFRWRVVPVKFAAAFAALSSGGSGGREGPTMQIGAAIGSVAARLLPTSRRERRVLFVAGIAAGIAAVFRTPLGAALLATEMLYRDDFEADALVPSILASVIAYSVVIAAFGETTLLGITTRFPFSPRLLPLYGGLALLVSLAAAGFVRLLRAVQGAARRLPGPVWLRPAVGGLAAGVIGAGIAIALGAWRGPEARAFAVLGGGYGTAQVAMDGAQWFPGELAARRAPPRDGRCEGARVRAHHRLGRRRSGTSRPRSSSARSWAPRSVTPRRRRSAIRPSSRRRSRSSGWARSTAASPTCRSPRSCSSPSWPGATTCSSR